MNAFRHLRTRSVATALVFALAPLAAGAPFVVSDPLTVGVTLCGVYLDASPEVTVPVTVDPDGNICRYDLAGLGAGTHTIAMTAIALSDPVWGFQESAKSNPLTFTLSAPTAIAAIEYFHAAFNHYFVTSSADEISKLDAGLLPGWTRTGQTFKVYSAGAAGDFGMCRFFSMSFDPKSSHFYTPLASECAVVKQNPKWQFEGEVFSVLLPGGTGDCPSSTQPLYRLYNNGQGGAPNHRYTTSPSTRSDMIGQGWIPEGFGTPGVIACVPS